MRQRTDANQETVLPKSTHTTASRTFPTVLEFRHVTRADDEEWEKIEPAHIQIWEEASRILSRRSIEHDKCTASVFVDWQPLATRLAYLYGLRREASSDSSLNAFDWSPFWQPITLSGTITIQGENDLTSYDWYPGFFAELYAYDLFTIINLAYPGSCDFLTLAIKTDNGRVVSEPRLSAYSFDFAWVSTLAGKWPTVRMLPLEQVAGWHSSLKLGAKQTADTPVEKLLFAMLHLCRREDYAEAVIWIFYALEALVETRVGESISTMVRRVSLLLSLDEKQRAVLNKQLRKLYDLRSAIVHGGYRVTHPIAQEIVDRRIGEELGRALELYQFGVTIVFACLQELVARKWTDLSFQEIMKGDGEKFATSDLP